MTGRIAVVVSASPSPWQQIGWQVAEVLDCLCLGDDGWRRRLLAAAVVGATMALAAVA